MTILPFYYGVRVDQSLAFLCSVFIDHYLSLCSFLLSVLLQLTSYNLSFFLFLCWSVFMQQIWIYLIFISFSIKKNTDLKENRSTTCQICYLPLSFYCFQRKHRYQSRSQNRVVEPNYDRNSCICYHFGIFTLSLLASHVLNLPFVYGYGWSIDVIDCLILPLFSKDKR